MIGLINSNCLKILAIFNLSPGNKFTRGEIKDFSKMNNVILDESLTILTNLNFLEKKKLLYSLNFEKSKFILDELSEKFFGLPLEIQFLLFDYLDMIKKIKGIKRIILFGSFAKLTFSKKSDLDIAISFNSYVSKNIEEKIISIGKKMKEKYGHEIEEHFFIGGDFLNKNDLLIKDILRNGRNLF